MNCCVLVCIGVFIHFIVLPHKQQYQRPIFIAICTITTGNEGSKRQKTVLVFILYISTLIIVLRFTWLESDFHGSWSNSSLFPIVSESVIEMSSYSEHIRILFTSSQFQTTNSVSQLIHSNREHLFNLSILSLTNSTVNTNTIKQEPTPSNEYQ